TNETAAPLVALMFPGQGSQYAGMGKDLVGESSTAARVFEKADDILGYSLSRIMVGDDRDKLQRTIYTQPAVFVHSMALWAVLREHCEISPIVAAGHSLGEYSALCAADVLDFEQALDIIRVRATAMEEAQPPGSCGMAALVGPPGDEAVAMVEADRGDDVLEAANFNSPEQVVVSGHLSAVGRLVTTAKGRKRTKAVMLPVSSAFHTSLMQSARDALAEKLSAVRLGEGKFQVLANVNGEPYDSGETAKDLMIDQVVKPVQWVECVRTMKKLGASLFLEIGPGKVLSGLLRRIDRKARAVSISNLESIRAFQGADQ
ncbi:ACP S-malonyltransferase, partial [Thermodesulfobacteriota bacterium]